MSDIVERLRGSTVYGFDNEESDVGLQAADEIERLRAENNDLRNSAYSSDRTIIAQDAEILRLRAEVAALNQPVKLSEWQELVAERDRLRELLREACEDVENRKAFCLLISNAQGVGEYTREHTARLAERKKALLVRIDAVLKEGS